VEISVEALIAWTYADQRADLMPREDGPGRVVSQMGSLGGRVDGGGGAKVRLADDAELVDACVRACSSPALVMMHGRMRSRPDPRLGARFRLEPDWHVEPNGNGAFIRVAVPAFIQKTKAWWVPVHQVDRPDEVSRDRMAWISWAQALAEVMVALSDHQLTRYRLTDELPEVSPWDVAAGS